MKKGKITKEDANMEKIQLKFPDRKDKISQMRKAKEEKRNNSNCVSSNNSSITNTSRNNHKFAI